MTLEEFLGQLLLAIIAACVPVLTAYFVGSLKKQGEAAADKVQSEKAKDYIARITDAVARAVTYTNQTYVDSLKASGNFNAEAQKEAARKSLDAAMTILGPEVMKWISETSGDAITYLNILIEAAVKEQKTS